MASHPRLVPRRRRPRRSWESQKVRDCVSDACPRRVHVSHLWRSLFFPDINELNLPKTCGTEFPDPDDLLSFKLIICPDEVSTRVLLRSVSEIRYDIGSSDDSRRFKIINSNLICDVNNSMLQIPVKIDNGSPQSTVCLNSVDCFRDFIEVVDSCLVSKSVPIIRTSHQKWNARLRFITLILTWMVMCASIFWERTGSLFSRSIPLSMVSSIFF